MKAGKVILVIVLIIALAAAMAFVFANYSGEGAASHGSAVVINEVMSSNKGAVPDGTGGYPDWIELKNTSDAEISVAGFGLSDDLFAGAKYVFPAGAKIPAGGYIVVYCSGESTTDYHAPFKLSATDSAVLFDTSGNVLDSIALRAAQSGMSLALDGTGAFVDMQPSPGYSNDEAGIAEFQASLQSTEDIGVYINEFMASNATTIMDGNGLFSDWIELYNSNAVEVDLSGFGISDTLSQPMKAVLPEGTVIPANGYLLIYCSGDQSLSGDTELHVPFGLRAYEEDVVFSDASGGILDSFSYSRQESDISMARTPDGTGDFASTAQPTPGYPNTDEGYRSFTENVRLPLTDVYITELMSANSSTLARDGEYYDWIELHNGSSSDISLAGYALSDNPNNPAKWVFPDVTLTAGEYLVVYASGLNIADAQKKNDLNLNFAISSEGETVFLFDPEGKLIDKLSAGALMKDVSYGRNDADERFYYTAATPGAVNGAGFDGMTAEVAFSVTPGVFSAPVTLELSANSGDSIYYTLDCTTPTASSTRYTGALNITGNTVVRAVAVRDGFLTGYTVSGTYLFTTDGVDHTLPIATLVTDPDNLWDSKTGIYAYGDKYDPSLPTYADSLVTANFYEAKLTGDEAAWERPGNFAIFDGSGTEVFNQNIGMRIAGSFGRGRAQKGFNIIARDEYGDNRMAYSFFDNREYSEYKAVVLRAGAQDQNRSKIRDELAAGLLEGTDVNMLYQAYKPYVLYLNGEYWGVYFLKEKRNRFFVAQHEGIDNADDMDIGYASTRVTYGTNEEWKALMSYVSSHDLSVQANYDYVAENIDISSFTDYMICEIYVGNTDYANIQYYRLPGGKWRWIYYDFCWGFVSASHNTLSARRGDVPAASGLFNALLKNSSFKDAFIRRFAEIMNTVYDPDRVISKIDELYALVEPEMAREREKFCSETFMGVKQRAENLGTYDSFVSQIAALKTFATERPGYMKKFIKEEFDLSDSYMQEVFG